MKNIYTDTLRHYRQLESLHADERKFQVELEETDLLITVPYIDSKKSLENDKYLANLCLDFIQYLRGEIKAYSMLEPDFYHSLTPISYKQEAPRIAKAMCDAAKLAGVGPFAAVAGSVAQAMAFMLSLYFKDFPKNIIVENGGDIYMYSEKERIVGVLANPRQSENIGIKIKPENCPLSFCASSSYIGHSLSFGKGDIAMVIAKNAALADSLATAYCNMLKSSKDIENVLAKAKEDASIKISHNPFSQEEIVTFLEKRLPAKLPPCKELSYTHKKGGLLGVFLQCDDHIGIWGDIELVAL